jgi:outer membrane protein
MQSERTKGKSMKQVFNKFALAVVALAACGAASAQSAGSWFGKVGVNQIDPQVKSGDLSAPSQPGTKIDVKAATALILTAGYMVTDNFSVEFYAGLPYKHDVEGDGTIKGVGKLGSVKQVSPTLFAQYRFMEANAAFRPYVGLGLTYAHFYGEEGSATLTALTNPGGPPTRMSASSAFGLSPQVGATFKVNDHWFVDASVIKTYIKNKNTLSTGQTIDTKLDPLSTNISVGYRF